jgi:Na+-driven multidrug efflux pump
VKDLTEESIGKHILQMAVPIAAGMFFQTLYFLVDLYFVAHWGDAAIAGVAAAGLASSLAVAVGVVLLAFYFHRLERYVAFDATAWRPNLAAWGRLLRIGLPAGGEFALMFMYMAVMYWIIRRFGEDAQAGFGVGMRLMQSMLLPAMAVAFATAPIVGQNYAAGKFTRVRHTFAAAAWIGALIMGILTLLCQWRAEWAIRAFTTQPDAMAAAAQFLKVISWNFVASGLVFTCSAVFQGLGNTVPAVLSSSTRIVSFVAPALWIAAQPNFALVQLWYVSVASMTSQALVSLWLVRREFQRRLGAAQVPAPAPG